MPSVTDQQLLDAARSALLKRLNGDAYEAYTTREQQFVGMKIAELEAMVDRLEQKINATSGGSFRLVEGF